MSAFPSEAAQRRNSLVFLLNTALTYLVAPVFYVGVLHAAILKGLETSDTVANLPEAVYHWGLPLAVVISWVWPSPRLFRPMLTITMAVMGVAGLVVATLFLIAPAWLITALVVHAGVIGVASGVRQMCLWELLGRGLSPEWRAWTLGLTFGVGPLFAVVGSCVTQVVLSGTFQDLFHVQPVAAPWSYVVLFGATGPAMLLAAVLMVWTDVPPGPEPEKAAKVSEIVQGLRHYFLHPVILVTAIGFLLTYGGTMILNNLSLYAAETIGEAPEQYAGLQLMLRFGCKCVAGVALGWLVARVHAKASLLATTALCLVGVAWGLVVPGKWYLLSFGFLGAGELFYVYYLNYVVGCSAPERIRENTAYTNQLGVVVGMMPLVFGAVSDRAGLRTSFVVAMGIFAIAIVLVMALLPRNPPTPDSTRDVKNQTAG